MAPRLLALAGACALSLTVNAFAGNVPGPDMPPPPGMPPPPCVPEPDNACDLPALGEGEFPGEFPMFPPVDCGDGTEPREAEEEGEGEPGVPGPPEFPEMPPIDCLPMGTDMLDDDPGFRPGFLKRAWRFDAEANGFDAERAALDVTITKVRGLPKRFRDQDDALIDEFAYVLMGAKTKVFDADGDKLAADDRAAALGDADAVRAVGKLLSPDRWLDDEDTEPVATIRAKRIVIEE